LHAVVEMMKSDKSSFDKRDAIRQLALIPVEEQGREEIAAMLESLLAGDDASFYGEAAAEALGKWWRPHTVAALLPLLEENVWPPSKRQAAMKVLAKTGDRRAVFPIVRWIIKEPEAVVAALTEMGPVAEEEVIKLLRDKSPAIRTSASRILEQIGTNKCLPELRRAAADPRDPVAAGVAKAAVEMVVSRVAQSKKSATQPATRAAAASIAP
jgi:HEAT repeat protein